MISTEDKKEWCKSGAEFEIKFCETMQSLGFDIKINPEKNTNKYAPDLLFSGRVSDLKHIDTPFFLSKKYSGIDSEFAVTFNEKDLLRYKRKYPEIIILFYVSFKKSSMLGNCCDEHVACYWEDLEEIEKMCDNSKVVEYKNRINDTNGNAKKSFILDVRNMRRLCSWKIPQIKNQ